ncbi:MAG TPA: hypothetical protein VFU47_12980 [Armatimonadota bacterium]|nr:hypothetical protein [Armatimonadota bacterium]
MSNAPYTPAREMLPELVRRLPVGYELISAPNGHVLRARLARAERRGELARVSHPWTYRDGMTCVVVRRLRSSAPQWHRSARVGTIVAGSVMLAFALLWLVVSAVVSMATATFSALGVTGMVAIGAAVLASAVLVKVQRRRYTEVTVTTRVRVRR